MRKVVFVLALALVAPEVACRKTDTGKPSPKVAAPDPAEKAQSVATGEVKAKTLADAQSLFAQGFNKMIGPMKSTIEDYEREIPTPPRGAPEHKPVLTAGIADRDLDEVGKLFAQARQATPPSHVSLADVADATLNAARALRKTFAEAVRYYGAENYKDDKGEGGKSIDTRMRTDIGSYENNVRQLQDRLGAIELEAMERELKEIPPTVAGHHFRAVNLAAKRLVEVRDQTNKVLPALEALRAANQELKKFAESHVDIVIAFKNYVSLVEQFETQAIAFARDVKNPGPDPKSLQRNTTLLVSRYNTLVQMGNTLYQLEDQGLLK